MLPFSPPSLSSSLAFCNSNSGSSLLLRRNNCYSTRSPSRNNNIEPITTARQPFVIGGGDSSLPLLLSKRKRRQQQHSHHRRSHRSCSGLSSLSSSSKHHQQRQEEDEEEEEEEEALFIRRELARFQSLEQIVDELENDTDIFDDVDGDGDDDEEEDDAIMMLDADVDIDDDDDAVIWDGASLQDLFESLDDEMMFGMEEEDDDDDNDENDGFLAAKEEEETETHSTTTTKTTTRTQRTVSGSDDNTSSQDWLASFENVLLQGVVPASVGVGSNCLPGDFGFDPLDLASKDLFRPVQSYIINLVPARDYDGDDDKEKENAKQQPQQKQEEPRPKALIVRDYREAEIRHSRLAMLAAMFWPLQEMLDRLVLPEDDRSSVIGLLLYDGKTLPFFPLLMTAIMLLLGYLDIYSQAVKDMDRVGEAFLPGDCFWDPLSMLQGAPPSMERNMQERELFNGRMAMLAIAVYVFEESATGKAVIDIKGNEMLFTPLYQIPYVQQWLDERFITSKPEPSLPEIPPINVVLPSVPDSIANMLPTMESTATTTIEQAGDAADATVETVKGVIETIQFIM